MTATNQTVREYSAGDDVTLEVTVENEDGTVVDISGASIEWGLARRPSDSPLVTKSTSSGGITITDAANGEFAIEVDATDTEDLGSGSYYHEAELTDSAGEVSTVLTGQFRIDDDLV